jgi:hypothetical protein
MRGGGKNIGQHRTFCQLRETRDAGDTAVSSASIRYAGHLARALAALVVALVALVALAWGSVGLAQAAPTITIEHPLAGSFTKSQTPTIGGTTDDSLDPLTLHIYVGESTVGPPVQSQTLPLPALAWETVPETALAPGQYTVLAEQTNGVPETGVSAPVSFTVDPTPPEVSIDSVPSPTKDSTPTLTGGAGTDAGDHSTVEVTIYRGGSVGGEIVASEGVSVIGSGWSYTAPHLSDGTYTALARQGDEAGNTGFSGSVTFTVDTTAPAVSIDPVATPTDNPTPTLTGGAGTSAGDSTTVVVTVYKGGSVGGSVAASQGVPAIGSGWSYTAPHLADGTYTAQATQGDEAGNAGVSGPVTFTVDTTAPAVSINHVATPTNDPTPTLTGGAGTNARDSATVEVTIYRGGSVGGEVAASHGVSVIGSGWSYTAPHLADGTYTAQATQTKEAGNTGVSGPVTFTVDTTPPAVSINPVASPTNDPTPTLTGGAGTAAGDHPTIKVTVYKGGAVGGEVVVSQGVPVSGGAWSYTTPHLNDGTYTAQAAQRDEAGNTGTSTDTFTIKTDAPTLNTVGLATRKGGFFVSATPSFSGNLATAPEDEEAVTVKIYRGSAPAGTPVQTLEAAVSGSAWTVGPVAPLEVGTYTAQAEQKDRFLPLFPDLSEKSTFTVDAEAPQVTLTSPASGSSTSSSTQSVGGTAGTDEGDSPTVTIELFAGQAIGGQPLEGVTAQATGGAWTAAFAGLAPGAYTAQAEQRDDVGNAGRSVPTTFTVLAPTPPPTPAPSPPVASFQWFPVAPHVGEPVALVSSSTDASAAITGFAWDPTDSGAFVAGGSVITTSFSTLGDHIVRLRVTDTNGLSSIATEKITIDPTLMQPFPVVRIAGSENSLGVRLSLLTVLAPIGARVTLTCRGPHCPTKYVDLVAASKSSKGRAGMVLIVFRRFERSLRAGTIVEIRISKYGQIGKYTRLVVRHGKLPIRVDSCLGSGGFKPIACPTS